MTKLNDINGYDYQICSESIAALALTAKAKALSCSDDGATHGEMQEAVMMLAAIGRRLDQIAGAA